MVRLSKSVFIKSVADKKHVPFVVSKSIDTSHNIEIALQETKSLALLKSTRKKSVPVIKTCLNELEDCYNSRKCSLTDVKKDLKEMTLAQSDELVNKYLCQEKNTFHLCPFLTPLKSKKTREISYSEHDKGMILVQNCYLNGDDLNLFSSPTEERGGKTDCNHYCDLEEVWAEFMYNFEDRALSTKLCSCILRKQKKLKTKSLEDDFLGNTSIGSSLVSVLVQDRYWQMNEIHKNAFNERRHPGIDQYEQTQDLLKNLPLNHSKSEKLKRCMFEIKQLHDSLKNKM